MLRGGLESMKQLLLLVVAILFLVLPRSSFSSEPIQHIKATCWSMQLGERLCILGTDNSIEMVEAFGKKVDVSDKYFKAGAIEVEDKLHIIIQLREQ